MSSKTPTKVKRSKRITTPSAVSSKANPRVMKKKRASTSSARPSVQAKLDYSDEQLRDYREMAYERQKALDTEMAKMREASRAESQRVIDEALERQRLLSAKAAKSGSTSAPTYSRRGLYDGITIESTGTLNSSAALALTGYENSRSPAPENEELGLQIYAKLPGGLPSTQQFDTSNPSERRNYALFWISGGAVAFIIGLTMLLSKAVL